MGLPGGNLVDGLPPVAHLPSFPGLCGLRSLDLSMSFAREPREIIATCLS